MNRAKIERDNKVRQAEYAIEQERQIKLRGKPFRTLNEGPKIICREDHNMTGSRLVDTIGVVSVDWPDGSQHYTAGQKHMMVFRSCPSGNGEFDKHETGIFDMEECKSMIWWFDTLDVEEAIGLYFKLTQEWEKE